MFLLKIFAQQRLWDSSTNLHAFNEVVAIGVTGIEFAYQNVLSVHFVELFLWKNLLLPTDWLFLMICICH
jgi:hypothetical protein